MDPEAGDAVSAIRFADIAADFVKLARRVKLVERRFPGNTVINFRIKRKQDNRLGDEAKFYECLPLSAAFPKKPFPHCINSLIVKRPHKMKPCKVKRIQQADLFF